MSSTGLPGPGSPHTQPAQGSLAAHGAPEVGFKGLTASKPVEGVLPDALGEREQHPKPLPVGALLRTPGCKGSAF